MLCLLLLLLLLLLQELAKGPKLVLRAEGEAQLMAVADAARAQGLACHSIAEPTGGQQQQQQCVTYWLLEDSSRGVA
jgi:hypothetical protein